MVIPYLIIIVLYIVAGFLPVIWYYHPQRQSRGYLLIPLIAMLGILCLPPVLEFYGIPLPTTFTSIFGIAMLIKHMLPSIFDQILNTPWGRLIIIPPSIVGFFLINLITTILFIGLTAFNPAQTPENRSLRRWGIIATYVAYIINAPWWALASLAGWM